MIIDKELIQNNNAFLQKEEMASALSLVFIIKEQDIDKISREEWAIKVGLLEMYLNFYDKYYWTLSEKKEKQIISRLTDVLRRQKMVCEYALMDEIEKNELGEIAASFVKKVQSSVKNVKISAQKKE